MNKNELTTKELNDILLEANESTNGGYENIIKYEAREFWDNFTMDNPLEVALMVAYGTYKPYHDYVGHDGYGNIESMTKEEYREELLYYFDEYSKEV